MKTLLTFLWLLLASLGVALAQPTLDATNHTNSSSGGLTTTVTVSTSATNEVVTVISVLATTNSSGGTETATISGCGLTWTPLVSYSYGQVNSGTWTVGIIGWYSFSASIVSSCTATITSALTIDDASTMQFAVAGTHTAAPIDPNGSLPSTTQTPTVAGSGSCGTTKVGGVFSTSLAHDLVVMVNGSNNTNVTLGTPCNSETKYLTNANSGGTRFSYLYSQYASYTATQSSVTMAQTTGSPANGPGVAIVAFTADTAAAASGGVGFGRSFP